MRYTALVMPCGVVQLDAAVLVDLAVDVEDVAQHREQVLLDAADHPAVDERAAGALRSSSLTPQAWRTMRMSKSRVALEDRARVVGLAAGVQHRERAAAVQRVEAAARGVEQPVDLLLREVLEAAASASPARRRTPASSAAGIDTSTVPHHGRISIGMPAGVRSQMSTMSELLTRDAAVGPVVAARSSRRGLRGTFGWPWIMIRPPGRMPSAARARAGPASFGYDTSIDRKKSLRGLRRDEPVAALRRAEVALALLVAVRVQAELDRVARR